MKSPRFDVESLRNYLQKLGKLECMVDIVHVVSVQAPKWVPGNVQNVASGILVVKYVQRNS
jgi:hypothetical protein